MLAIGVSTNAKKRGGPKWNVAMQPGKRRQLDPTRKWARLLEKAEQLKASVRAKATAIMQDVCRAVRQQHDVTGTELQWVAPGRVFKNRRAAEHHVEWDLPRFRGLVRYAPRDAVEAANFQLPGYWDHVEKMA